MSECPKRLLDSACVSSFCVLVTPSPDRYNLRKDLLCLISRASAPHAGKAAVPFVVAAGVRAEAHRMVRQGAEMVEKETVTGDNLKGLP